MALGDAIDFLLYRAGVGVDVDRDVSHCEQISVRRASEFDQDAFDQEAIDQETLAEASVIV